MKSRYLDGSVVECPVGLLLTESGDRRNAATISFFSEVAHHPTSLWISLDPTSLSKELIDESGRFTLIVLHDGQKEIAERCGLQSGRNTDKFSGLKTHRGAQDFLYMDEAYGSAACRVRSSHPAGDHVLIIADILAGEVETKYSQRRALLTRDLL